MNSFRLKNEQYLESRKINTDDDEDQRHGFIANFIANFQRFKYVASLISTSGTTSGLNRMET